MPPPLITMEPCWRCHRVGPSLETLGPLRLYPPCAAQGLTTPCGDYRHAYQGDGQRWVCLRCGQTLTPQSITP
jgi:hypothetical protein